MRNVSRILAGASAAALIGVATVFVVKDESGPETQYTPPVTDTSEALDVTTSVAENATSGSIEVIETAADHASIEPPVSEATAPALSATPSSINHQTEPAPLAEPADRLTATTTDNDHAQPDQPSPAQTASYQDQQRTAAKELSAATAAANPNFGVIGACFDQMRSFACPILGQIPVVRDVVGQVSLVLGISCPQGDVRPI